MREKLKESLLLFEIAGGCLVMILVMGVPIIIGIKFLVSLVEWLF